MHESVPRVQLNRQRPMCDFEASALADPPRLASCCPRGLGTLSSHRGDDRRPLVEAAALPRAPPERPRNRRNSAAVMRAEPRRWHCTTRGR